MKERANRMDAAPREERTTTGTQRHDSPKKEPANENNPDSSLSVVLDNTKDSTDKLQTASRRRPPAELEDRIEAAIAARKQHWSGSAAANDDKTNTFTPIVGQYEYLDHTADVQLHAWGRTLSEAMEHLVLSMFGYLTDLRLVKDTESVQLPVVQGHDVESLMFAFLQEWLGIFHETGFVVRNVQVQELVKPSSDDEQQWSVTCSATGEKLNLSKHAPGTEVKAITYSNLQVVESCEENGDNRFDIWVIVDI